MPRYEQYEGEEEGAANKRVASNMLEDMVMDSFKDEEMDLFGGSMYSMMEPEEQSQYNELSFDFLNSQFESRDSTKYGSLDFPSYISGLAPDELFIKDLKKMSVNNSDQDVIGWNEVFGENMDEMKQAAMTHYQGLTQQSSPQAGNNNPAGNSYNMGNSYLNK